MTRKTAKTHRPRGRSRLLLAIELILLAAIIAGGVFMLTRDDAVPSWASQGNNGARVTINDCVWRVELAIDPADRYRGLGGRAALAKDAGMLFVFPEPDVQVFCMRDCLFDLDIAFLDADRRVIAIHTMRAEPERAGIATYSSNRPALYALEVRSGALAAAGVTLGDQAQFSKDIFRRVKAAPLR